MHSLTKLYFATLSCSIADPPRKKQFSLQVPIASSSTHRCCSLFSLWLCLIFTVFMLNISSKFYQISFIIFFFRWQWWHSTITITLKTIYLQSTIKVNIIKPHLLEVVKYYFLPHWIHPFWHNSSKYLELELVYYTWNYTEICVLISRKHRTFKPSSSRLFIYMYYVQTTWSIYYIIKIAFSIMLISLD